jgi:hypothetical protein
MLDCHYSFTGSKSFKHSGPYTYCAWSRRVQGLEGHTVEHYQDWLCETCITTYSAFRFPGTKQEEMRKK